MAETTKTPGTYDSVEDVDGLLVRYLDGELSGTEEEEIRTILEGSAEARRRLGELRSGSETFSERLVELPIPAVPEFSSPALPEFSSLALPAFSSPAGTPVSMAEGSGPRARASFAFSSLLLHHRIAAGIVLLILAVSFLDPVRAWIVDGVRMVASVVTPSEELSEPVTGGEAGPSSVSFLPVGGELVVSVEGHQASGRLTLVVVEGPEASGEASIQEAGVELLVLPHGIEVRNGPGSVADYTVGVPRTLPRVRVLVGGREVGVESPGGVEVGHTWVFELSGREG